jgi:UPF0755 protein
MPKKSKKKFLSISFALVILLVSATVVVISSLAAPSPKLTKTERFVIPKGQSIAGIAERLEDAGLIRSHWAFRLWVSKNQLQNKIQAGSFELSDNLTLPELALALTRGTDDLWVTVPEGWRREEIAASLAKQELSEFDEKEFLQLTTGLEGQLFPDTYLLSKESSTKAVAQLFANTFESRVKQGLATQLAEAQMSLNEVLTLASLVQRESANEAEMPLVAGILLNRMEIQMPLQVDATLQYVKATGANGDWWPDALAADKELDSLYNTYQHAGLPPAPICNPGLDAIKAVLSPEKTSALYYLHDSQGQIHTAQDLAGHNANVNKYLR